MNAAPLLSLGFLFSGIVIGALVGVSTVFVLADEPLFTLRNGVLKGWEVTRDHEVLVCRDPMVFIRAKQIECE